ncbi:hypothetical protein [Mycolicibacterium bacteremicum]|uniref:hypothetical protein n=1 Tax=Mycolicibacterium bacteremicum TaxID=564198 RepID=UPI0026EE4448|nr:hypothetical protein [Mycolicibacterium bacteremicum]
MRLAVPVSKKRKPKKGRRTRDHGHQRLLNTIPFWEFESAAKDAAELDPDPEMTTEVFIEAMLSNSIRVAPLTPDGRGYKTTTLLGWAEHEGVRLDDLLETLFKAYQMGALVWHEASATYEMKNPFAIDRP